MKHEGRILFGRDIRPEIEPRFTLWEKLKGIWVPQSIAFSSLILALPLPQKAVAYAVKALFYEVESVNIFQKNLVPAGQEKIAGFASATEFDDQLMDALRFFLERNLGLLGEEKNEFIREAAEIKRQGFRGSRWGCPRTLPEGFLDYMEHQCRGYNRMGRQFLRNDGGIDKAKDLLAQAVILIRAL